MWIPGVEIVGGGGSAANWAVACSRLGLRCALISNVGGDRAGEDVIAILAGEHVDGRFIHAHPRQAPATTSSSATEPSARS